MMGARSRAASFALSCFALSCFALSCLAGMPAMAEEHTAKGNPAQPNGETLAID